MPTCNQIIGRALSKLGVIPAGGSPSADDLSLGLDTLIGLYRRFNAEGLSGPLDNVKPLGPFTAAENQRVFRSSDAVTAVTLPELVPNSCDATIVSDYGAVVGSKVVPQPVDTSGRFPHDGSVVTVTDALTASRTDPATDDYIYDGSVKAWVVVGDLTANDYAPLSFRDALGLASCLAVELADDYGLAVGQATVRAAQRYQLSLATNLSFAREDVTPVTYF